MKKFNLAIDYIDYLIITHFHGDHIGGIPSLLLHLKDCGKQNKPIQLIGPVGVLNTITNLSNMFFGSRAVDMESIELSINDISELELDDFSIKSYPMRHKPESLGYKMLFGDISIGITGDTGYNENIKLIADNVDYFIVECSFKEEISSSHITLKEVLEIFAHYNCKNIILNHLSNDVISEFKKSDVPNHISLSYDGMKIEK